MKEILKRRFMVEIKRDLEEILRRFQFELDDPITRATINATITSYFNTHKERKELSEFRVEDLSTTDLFHFRIYLRFSLRDLNSVILDVRFLKHQILITDFENDKVGRRWIPPLEI